MHRPCLIYPGQHQCELNVLFFDFQYIKLMYMYIVLKIYMKYKTILMVSDFVLARQGSKNVFNRPLVFKCETKTTDNFIMFLCKSYKLYFMLSGCKCEKLIKTPRYLGFMSYMFT